MITSHIRVPTKTVPYVSQTRNAPVSQENVISAIPKLEVGRSIRRFKRQYNVCIKIYVQLVIFETTLYKFIKPRTKNPQCGKNFIMS